MDVKFSTIYDVAKVAGVSISTVSRVLNAPYQVREPTRQKVLQAIERLQFVPKAEAIARARKTFGRIGVLTPSLTMLSFVERLRGVANALHNTDYELIVYSVTNTTQLQHHLDLLSASKRVDGLVVMTLPIDEKSLTRLLTNGVEVVCIEVTNPLCCNITVNNTLGGELVAQYFLEQGYQPCAYIGESFDIAPETNNSAKRLQGFQEGLHKHGIELPEAYIRLLPLTMENVMNGVIAQTHHLLDLPDPPEAIFTYSDLYAIGVLKAARSRNLSVPEDLALIGFDNIDVADFMELTTVDQHLEESGRLAIEVLLARIANPSQVVRNIELQAQIKTRGTA
jgi:LacI family transcriptional regulator